MGVVIGRTRKLASLRKGDIVCVKVPFEENTRDYYNGYAPKDIRGGQPFVDRFGQQSKRRMVIFIGRDNETMLYLPLTSKSDTNSLPHQYILADNSMTPHPEGMLSYVEMDSLRAMYISYDWEISYTGRIAKEDRDNIMHRLVNKTLQFNSMRDQRGYVPEEAESVFVDELKHQGYELTYETDYRKTYTKNEKTVTRTKFGMVHYHVQMSKEQVYAMVCCREGYDIRRRREPQKPRNVVTSPYTQSRRQNAGRREAGEAGRLTPFPAAVSLLTEQRNVNGRDYANTC